MSTLSDKLKLDKMAPFWLINAPAGIAVHFDGLVLKKTLSARSAIAQILLFARSVSELDELVAHTRGFVNPGTLYWVAFPKKSGSIKSDISRDHGWETLAEMKYEAVIAISIDNDWSALRFKPVSAKSTYVPPQERKIEGIDFIARTVTLSADAKALMKNYKGLVDFFDQMSFSHKKEYVAAIAEAKKPETRHRRIEKMIEALLKMKEQKEKKNQNGL